jgi:AcrR family transcriptional regulator
MRQRARQPEQKKQRREALINAAWRCFEQNEYEEIAMSDVAGEAGVSKGTVYLYFGTKEELFLTVLIRRFAGWFDGLDAAVVTASYPQSPQALASLVAASLSGATALRRLFAISHLVLEQNSDYAAVREFKELLRARLEHSSALIAARTEFLDGRSAARFLLRAYSVLLGVEQLSRPSAVAEEVMRSEPGLDMFVVEFDREFRETLQTIARGMAEAAARREDQDE